jgi:hypothetical protein
MDKVRLSEPFNTTKPASIAKKDFQWSAVRPERNDPIFRCGVDLDEASPGIIAFAPKGLASQLSAPLIYMLASDIVTPRNVRDTQTINANLFNDSQFPGVRPSATTLNTNQNFLSHNFHPCYR